MNERVNERFYFRHVIRASHNGSVAKSRSMLNIAIFDPWQRSLFSRQRTPGKEPLLAGKFPRISKEILRVIVICIVLYVLVWARLNCDRFKEGISILNKLLDK